MGNCWSMREDNWSTTEMVEEELEFTWTIKNYHALAHMNVIKSGVFRHPKSGHSWQLIMARPSASSLPIPVSNDVKDKDLDKDKEEGKTGKDLEEGEEEEIVLSLKMVGSANEKRGDDSSSCKPKPSYARVVVLVYGSKSIIKLGRSVKPYPIFPEVEVGSRKFLTRKELWRKLPEYCPLVFHCRVFVSENLKEKVKPNLVMGKRGFFTRNRALGFQQRQQKKNGKEEFLLETQDGSLPKLQSGEKKGEAAGGQKISNNLNQFAKRFEKNVLEMMTELFPEQIKDKEVENPATRSLVDA